MWVKKEVKSMKTVSSNQVSIVGIGLAIVSLTAGVFLFQNCAKTKIGDLKDDSDANQQAFALLNGRQMIAVQNASSEQCPSGGKVYAVYTDDNGNMQLDSTEEVLSTQRVCNGATGAAGVDGQSGSNSMISMNRVKVESTSCASLSGVQLSSGLDTDRDGVLDSSEIMSTTILCDGANGEVGAAGPAGSNGHSMVFSVVSASVEVCSNGGSVIMMALDTEGGGVYHPGLPNQQSATICNGANGMNAQASPYQIVDVIRPCGNTIANKEILLRLQNGQILASVSDNVSGKNTRLAFVADGNYINTDPTACQFSISTTNKVRSVSWNGQVQVSWNMP